MALEFCVATVVASMAAWRDRIVEEVRAMQVGSFDCGIISLQLYQPSWKITENYWIVSQLTILPHLPRDYLPTLTAAMLLHCQENECCQVLQPKVLPPNKNMILHENGFHIQAKR